MGAVYFPGAPPSLTPAPRAFYDALREMIVADPPPRLDGARSSARFGRGGVGVTLAHAERKDWSIVALVRERDAIVSVASTSKRFAAPTSPSPAGDPAWPFDVLDFVTEILHGHVETRTTYRGETPISADHVLVGTTAAPIDLGRSNRLVPAQLFVWRAKRVEIVRAPFF